MEKELKRLLIYPVLTGRVLWEADTKNVHKKVWEDLRQETRDWAEQVATNLRSALSLCCECGKQAQLVRFGGGPCKPCSILSPRELEIYALLHQDFARGAYDERQSGGSYGEDGKEELADQMEEKAHNAGYNIVYQTIHGVGSYVLEPMTAQEKLEYDAALIAVQIEQDLHLLNVSATLYYQRMLDQMAENPDWDHKPFTEALAVLDEAAARLGWKFQVEDARVVLMPLPQEELANE